MIEPGSGIRCWQNGCMRINDTIMISATGAPPERENLTLRGIDHRRPLRMMDGIDQRRAGSTAVDPYGCGGFITVDDAGSTTVDPYT